MGINFDKIRKKKNIELHQMTCLQTMISREAQSIVLGCSIKLSILTIVSKIISKILKWFGLWTELTILGALSGLRHSPLCRPRVFKSRHKLSNAAWFSLTNSTYIYTVHSHNPGSYGVLGLNFDYQTLSNWEICLVVLKYLIIQSFLR